MLLATESATTGAQGVRYFQDCNKSMYLMACPDEKQQVRTCMASAHDLTCQNKLVNAGGSCSKQQQILRFHLSAASICQEVSELAFHTWDVAITVAMLEHPLIYARL